MPMVNYLTIYKIREVRDGVMVILMVILSVISH